jgi:hypothetical protein
VQPFSSLPPSELPAFIDNPEEYMPRRSYRELTFAWLSGLHKDLLLELPQYVKNAGIKALIAPIEDWQESSHGHKEAIGREMHGDLGLECSFPKPFCTLEPEKGTSLQSQSSSRKQKLGVLFWRFQLHENWQRRSHRICRRQA